MSTSQMRVEPTQVAPQLYAALDLLHKDAVKIDEDVLTVDTNIRAFRAEQEVDFDATNANIVKVISGLNELSTKLSNLPTKTDFNAMLVVLNQIEVNTRKTP